VRFSLDGGLSRTTPLAARAEFGRLAWTGTEAAIVYGAQPDDSGGMFIQRLDGLGAALGPPVRLANLEFRATPSVAVGQDVLAVLMGPDMTSVGKNLSVLRLARDGALVAGPFDVARDYVSSPSIAATSAGFFLAWIGGPGEFPGHIGVARLEAPMP
jgi:hypothetical protein